MLGLLFVANILNYADRTIISVLAQSIKVDLDLKDSELGFLYGTAFVVFNAVFSVVMGRLADSWLRGRLMAIGLMLWSGATMLSGFASSYAVLAITRAAVGVGEATINPCSHSLLTDLFPRRQRATVLSLYLCGVFIGMAAAIGVGGWFAESWSGACSAVAPALCGLRGWQMAFIVAGAPGLIVAVLVYRIREETASRPVLPGRRALARLGDELANLLPPFSLLRMDDRARRWNLLSAAGMIVAVLLMIVLTGDRMQWIGLAFGLYALLSWGHVVRSRDPGVYRLTMGSPAFVCALLGFALIGSIAQAINFWAIPFAVRTIGLSPARSGALIGIILGLGSVTGTVLGGRIADAWRRRTARAPLYMGILSLLAAAPFVSLMLTARAEPAFLAGFAGFALFSQCWAGGAAAYVQDLSASRMRATTSAVFATSMILISFALGPYLAGKLGEVLGSLRAGMLSLYVLAPVAVVLLLFAARAVTAAFAARDDVERMDGDLA